MLNEDNPESRLFLVSDFPFQYSSLPNRFQAHTSVRPYVLSFSGGTRFAHNRCDKTT